MQIPNSWMYLIFISEFIEANFFSVIWSTPFTSFVSSHSPLPIKLIFSFSCWLFTYWWSIFIVSLTDLSPFPLAFLITMFITSFAFWSYSLGGSPSPHRFRTEAVIDGLMRSFFVSVKYLRNWYPSTPLFFHLSSKFFHSAKNSFSSK